jgi:hypothetical protein
MHVSFLFAKNANLTVRNNCLTLSTCMYIFSIGDACAVMNTPPSKINMTKQFEIVLYVVYDT